MEGDCRIPVACCRPRVLVLHALFWGLVSLRVFGAALLSEEKSIGTVTGMSQTLLLLFNQHVFFFLLPEMTQASPKILKYNKTTYKWHHRRKQIFLSFYLQKVLRLKLFIPFTTVTVSGKIQSSILFQIVQALIKHPNYPD
uniref:Uncharacterized protein n=1 Tax=Pundamilia nyererei TaxID=303518 RepID=A0A3B4FCC0_9CICH